MTLLQSKEYGIPGIVENFFGNEGVSDELYSVAYTGYVGGPIFVLVGALCAHYNYGSWFFYLGLFMIGFGTAFHLLGSYMLKTGEVSIPADPVSVGILLIWGRRVPVILTEKTVMKAAFWPLRITYEVIQVGPVDVDFVFNEVLCKDDVVAGGEADNNSIGGSKVKIEVSLSIQPTSTDGEGLIRWLNYGRLTGFKAAFKEIIGEELRQYALGFSWAEIIKQKDDIAKSVRRVLDPTDAQRQSAIVDGLPLQDLQEYGVFLKRVSVPPVVLVGGLAIAAEEAAAESQQRLAELRDAKTLQEIAQNLFNAAKIADSPITMKQAIDTAQVNRKRATQQIIDLNSGNLSAAAAAAIIGRK